MNFYKYLVERNRYQKVSVEVLVTFTHYNQHFNVDRDKSDRLP